MAVSEKEVVDAVISVVSAQPDNYPSLIYSSFEPFSPSRIRQHDGFVHKLGVLYKCIGDCEFGPVNWIPQ